MNFSRILVSAWLALLLPAATAAGFAPTQAELAALPAYCAARLNEQSDAFKSWKASMGSDFLHIHHYCFALNFMNRARGMSSGKDKQGTLGAAMTNFEYVLKYTQPDFYLRPEILMNRGVTQSMQGRDGAAVSDLLKAIEMDPKLPRAYIALADLYSKQKNRSKALETVTAGLRHNPDTKSLQRRYTELGGKLPYPEPLQPVAAEPAAGTPGASPAAAAATPAEPASPVAASSAADPAATPAMPAAQPATEPKIGSPTNPYCRFCPD
jgi:tetratricopeptide (TPR) repeat protein